MFNFFRKMFGTVKEANRFYKFPLPYKIQAVYLHYGLVQLKEAGVFQKLPKDLQVKWQKAMDNWHDVRVTKSDLDRIGTPEWTKIAENLGLKWEEIADDSSD